MSTPLYQEALIEARKLREAAAAEAKNAVLEAVSPLIKQMIDKEISGIIVEQEEPMAAAGDLPPPAPPPPSPDAGATGPVDAMPPAGIEPASPTPMPGMTPAVAAASPPIAPAGTPVMGKIDVGPTGEQQLVIDINSLFANETTPAETGATAVPPAEATPEAAGAAPMPPAAPESLKEIYLAVQRLLREQGGPPPPPAPPTTPDASGAAPPVTPTPNTAAPVGQQPQQPQIDPATGQPIATPAGAAPGTAGPATATVDQLVAQPQIDPATGQPIATPAGSPPPPAGSPPPPAGAPPPPAGAPPPPAGAPPPPAGPMQEYKVYKTNFELVEQRINSLRNVTINPSFVKEGFEKKLFGLYQNLIDLKNRNAISPKLFSFNEDRLGLLYENLNVITSYNRNPLIKGKNMANKNSLKDLVHALFEGAEGFEEPAGKVSLPADSEGGSAEHAHKVSGNPKGVRAEAEKAPFSTKQKKEWPGKPSPESLLEQLEEEISELMAEMGGSSSDEYVYPESSEEDEDDEMSTLNEDDEAVLEFDSDEVVNEAKKARARLKALREQAEEDKLSLTIDLDGVRGADVSNVNVSLDGESLDVDMEEEDMEEPEMGDEEEEVDLHMGDEEMPEEEEEEEEETLKEARKIVRRAASEASSLHENKVLRGQLAETQLLTARSLFVNKLFVRDDLSGAQKRKIVEYLDSARTLAEAKEVYNRIVRVLNTAKKSGMMNESYDGRRILGEGAGQIVEPSFDTSRWQVLAGVKKSGK